MKHLLLKEWRLLLFGFLMSFCSMPGQTVYISLFSGHLREELGLSHGSFGGIYSLATLCSSLVLTWSGALTDSVSLRKLSLTVLLSLAVASWFVSITSDIIILFLVLFALRQFGQGLMNLCSITALVRYLPQNRGKATAIGSMGYSCAEAIIPPVLIVVVAMVGWRMSWVIVSGVLIFCVIPVIWWLLRTHAERHYKYNEALELQNSKEEKSVQDLYQWKRKEVLRDPAFYMAIPNLMSHSFLFTGFFFHQVHLVEVKGWSISDWTSLFSIYAFCAIGVMMISGILIDRIGARKIFPFSSLPMGLGLVALSFFSRIEMAMVYMVLIGVSSGMIVTITAPFWVEVYGVKYLGSIKSLSSSLMVFFSALSPVLLGSFLDFGIDIESLMLGGAMYTLLTTLLAWGASVKYRDSFQKPKR